MTEARATPVDNTCEVVIMLFSFLHHLHGAARHRSQLYTVEGHCKWTRKAFRAPMLMKLMMCVYAKWVHYVVLPLLPKERLLLQVILATFR